MADATLAPDQKGIYEIALAAGTVYTVASTSVPVQSDDLTVLVHSGGPVYVKNASTVAAKDPYSTMVMAGQWVDGISVTTQLALVSSAASVVSVYRTPNQ